ncbi:undecaprenyl phosphate transporter UptA [Massilibacterium senegalense]|uniref:DedA family protein n=1 Tax=Massilibacterium senegalense TaxID=1632858 RepID=UPI00078416C5|nr:DedA family protein [Massilibacterium senegalense]
MKEFIMTVLMWLADLEYFGIAIGLMIEIIPSEIVLAFGGYMVSIGKINFIGAVIAGTIGGVIAQWFIYWMGYYGGRPFLLKYGKYIFIKEEHINVAETWFQRYGVGVIFTARFVPVVRHAISIPAGIAKMPFGKFTLYTTLAVIPWSIFFIYLGLTLGENWENVKTIAAPYVNVLATIVIVGLVFYFGWKMIKKNK